MKVWIKTRTSDGYVSVHRDPPRGIINKTWIFQNTDGDTVVEVVDSYGSISSSWVEVDLLQ